MSSKSKIQEGDVLVFESETGDIGSIRVLDPSAFNPATGDVLNGVVSSLLGYPVKLYAVVRVVKDIPCPD